MAERKAQETPPSEGDVTLSAKDHEALKAKAEEADSCKDRYLRALAEFDNTRKRLERDREASMQFAAERIVAALLPIVDSFEHALKAMEQAPQPASTLAGVKLIHRQLIDLLEKEGVQRIEALGKPFDHHRHEAVQQVETCDAAENTIVEEVQAGYTLRGKMIRPSLVKVAKQPATSNQQSANNQEEPGSGQESASS